MYHNFISCDIASIVNIDNILVCSFEQAADMRNYAAYVSEKDANAILSGQCAPEVSFIGSCHYTLPFGKEPFGFYAFVCPTNVNLNHLSGLAIDSFKKNPPKEVMVIKNLRLGTPEDPEWVAGGTAAVVIGFAIRSEPCEHGPVSRGRILALAKDAGNRLVFCVIDTGTDFEDVKTIRTSRMCQVDFNDPTEGAIMLQHIVPSIPFNTRHQFDLLLHDATIFAKTQG